MNGPGHLVLGAGCAGLGLAVALLDAGVREPITIVDRRPGYTRDRTWCLWDTGDERWRRLARHRWCSWRVQTACGTAVQRSVRHPYLRIDATDYYDWALERLARAPNVELRLGVRAGKDAEGGWVHDARGLASPDLDVAGVGLWQGFLGWEVEADARVFDPAVATLMDFRVPQEGEIRFVYVLPLSPTRALVEHTSFGARAAPAAERRAALEAWLGERLGARDWRVTHEEVGRLPMVTGLGTRPGGRTTAVGIAGGALRPSSGYAFARTQAHVTAVARALAAGRRPPRRIGSERGDALDAIFLRALAARPQDAPELFRTLLARTPGDTFARFMNDAASARDELRVMAALAPTRFLATAAGA